MSPSARKFIGSFGLLAYLVLYVALAATLGTLVLARAPAWLAPFYYIGAGLIWVVPLKPLFGWMNRP